METLDLTKVYQLGGKEITALRKTSLKVPRGSFVTITGPSGSGKTTFLNLISGLERPTEGRIILDGSDISDLSEKRLAEIRCKKVGLVFQLYNLIPVLTALENVELPTIAAGLPGIEGHSRALNLLKRVELKDRLHHKPMELSGGEQQRVAIARALVNNPSIILADEPTGNVDTATGLRIISLLKELNRERGVTVIVSTHDPLIADHADIQIKIRDGKIESMANRNRSTVS